MTQGEVTQLLAALRQGDEQARDRLFPLVYAELRRAASRQLQRETPGHTLEPTALVHEAYLKLAGPAAGAARNREHFVAIAARAMRQVLVDHARKRRAAKRGAGVVPVMISSQAAGVELPVEELVALDDALDRLNQLNPRLREVVELRFFGGLGEEDVARHLGVTVRTAQRDWAKARAFLYKELYPA